MNHPGIEVYLQAEVQEVYGFVGNFRTALDVAGGPREVNHGVAIIATGAEAAVSPRNKSGRDSALSTVAGKKSSCPCILSRWCHTSC